MLISELPKSLVMVLVVHGQHMTIRAGELDEGDDPNPTHGPRSWCSIAHGDRALIRRVRDGRPGDALLAALKAWCDGEE